MECKDFLAKTASKLLDNTPIHYRLVRSMYYLDPRLMASQKEGCVQKMKRVLEILVEAQRLKCDEVIYQFGQFWMNVQVFLTLKILTLVTPLQDLTHCCTNTWLVIRTGESVEGG